MKTTRSMICNVVSSNVPMVPLQLHVDHILAYLCLPGTKSLAFFHEVHPLHGCKNKAQAQRKAFGFRGQKCNANMTVRSENELHVTVNQSFEISLFAVKCMDISLHMTVNHSFKLLLLASWISACGRLEAKWLHQMKVKGQRQKRKSTAPSRQTESIKSNKALAKHLLKSPCCLQSTCPAFPTNKPPGWHHLAAIICSKTLHSINSNSTASNK